MGRMSDPTTLERVERLELANQMAAVERARWRKSATPGDPLRENRLRVALQDLLAAAAEVRSEIGRLQWSPALEATFGDRLRAASKRSQYERRALRKMIR